MVAISNSSPLILYAAIGRLHLLGDVFTEVIIPPGVWEEVVAAGAGRPGAKVRVPATTTPPAPSLYTPEFRRPAGWKRSSTRPSTAWERRRPKKERGKPWQILARRALVEAALTRHWGMTEEPDGTPPS